MGNFLFSIFYVIAILLAVFGRFNMHVLTSCFISICLVSLGVFAVKKYMYELKAMFGIGIVIMGLFYGLAAYLATYFFFLGPFISFLGVGVSLFVMILYLFWQVGRKRVNYIIKHEPLDSASAKEKGLKNYWKKLKHTVNLIKQYRYHRKNGHSRVFSLQLVYVEELKRKEYEGPKNALDFTILREVELQRNEYDTVSGKQRNS